MLIAFVVGWCATTASAADERAVHLREPHEHADPALFEEGAALLRSGLHDRAEGVFLEYLRAHPRSHAARTNLAVALLEQGRQEDAIEHFYKALDHGGLTDPQTRLSAGIALLRVYDRLVADGASSVPWMIASIVPQCESLEDLFGSAKQHLLSSVALNGTEPHGYLLLSEAYEKRGSIREAADWLIAAFRLAYAVERSIASENEALEDTIPVPTILPLSFYPKLAAMLRSLDDEQCILFARIGREKGSAEAAWLEIDHLQSFGFSAAAYEALYSMSEGMSQAELAHPSFQAYAAQIAAHAGDLDTAMEHYGFALQHAESVPERASLLSKRAVVLDAKGDFQAARSMLAEAWDTALPAVAAWGDLRDSSELQWKDLASITSKHAHVTSLDTIETVQGNRGEVFRNWESIGQYESHGAITRVIDVKDVQVIGVQQFVVAGKDLLFDSSGRATSFEATSLVRGDDKDAQVDHIAIDSATLLQCSGCGDERMSLFTVHTKLFPRLLLLRKRVRGHLLVPNTIEEDARQLLDDLASEFEISMPIKYYDRKAFVDCKSLRVLHILSDIDVDSELGLLGMPAAPLARAVQDHVEKRARVGVERIVYLKNPTPREFGVRNESSLISQLRQATKTLNVRFSVFDPKNTSLPFDSMIRMFSQTWVVIGSHSSVLSYLPFFLPDTTVIELPPHPSRLVYMDLAVSLRQHHHSVEAPMRPITGVYDASGEASGSVLQRTIVKAVKHRRYGSERVGLKHAEL